MTLIEELLNAIDAAKTKMVMRGMNKYISCPRVVGVQMAMELGSSEQLVNWISYLDDPKTAMNGLMQVVERWDTSNEESVAYYMEIISELKAGLCVVIDAVSF